jgi:hypothetical protein
LGVLSFSFSLSLVISTILQNLIPRLLPQIDNLAAHHCVSAIWCARFRISERLLGCGSSAQAILLEPIRHDRARLTTFQLPETVMATRKWISRYGGQRTALGTYCRTVRPEPIWRLNGERTGMCREVTDFLRQKRYQLECIRSCNPTVSRAPLQLLPILVHSLCPSLCPRAPKTTQQNPKKPKVAEEATYL